MSIKETKIKGFDNPLLYDKLNYPQWIVSTGIVENAHDSTLIVYISVREEVEKHTQYATWFVITKHRS